MSQEAKKRGRPRVWANPAARQQAYGARRTAKARAVEALLDAVRNARWPEPEVHHTMQYGDDLEVLAVLTEYYRARHWMRRRPPETAE